MQETGSPRHMQTLGLRKHLSKLAMDDFLQSERSQVASILSRPTSPGKIEVHNSKGRKRRRPNARIPKPSMAAPDIQIASTLQPSSPSNDSEDHLSEEPNGKCGSFSIMPSQYPALLSPSPPRNSSPESLVEPNISIEEAAVEPATLSSTTSGEVSHYLERCSWRPQRTFRLSQLAMSTGINSLRVLV
ncbi:hypothetical protein PABG_01349 [Paracoccidioides brasiliensis Pb03]|nr:hypothetical protein PABG_01349 [Paracoccidioides brasiliensis Pb03]